MNIESLNTKELIDLKKKLYKALEQRLYRIYVALFEKHPEATAVIVCESYESAYEGVNLNCEFHELYLDDKHFNEVLLNDIVKRSELTDEIEQIVEELYSEEIARYSWTDMVMFSKDDVYKMLR